MGEDAVKIGFGAGGGSVSLYTYGWNIPARFGRLGDLEEKKISECLYLYLYVSNITWHVGRFGGQVGGLGVGGEWGETCPLYYS